MCHLIWRLEGASLSSRIHCLWTCLLLPKCAICFPSGKSEPPSNSLYLYIVTYISIYIHEMNTSIKFGHKIPSFNPYKLVISDICYSYILTVWRTTVQKPQRFTYLARISYQHQKFDFILKLVFYYCKYIF